LRRIKKIIYGISIILLILIIYLFLFGKLFPYSPIKVGFSEHELKNTIIFVQDGNNFNDFQKIDTLTPAVEEFHNLKFTEKPKFYIFRDDDSYFHRTITKARFYAYPNGSIMISPWALKEAEEGKISLEIYLKHELSHILLYQHMGVLMAYKYYPDWLMEGIAVYSTNQMGTSFYPSKSETYQYIKQGNFVPPFDFMTKKEDEIKLDVKYRIAFMYSEFACIVDYLVTTYGKDKFMSYMNSLLIDNDHEKVFKQVYGIDFDNALIEFKKYVTENDSH
jgi:predicted SprT family Zn-dependent metalloprotease